MAKLSANGPELLRVSCESFLSDGTLKSELTTYEKITKVFHANGAILEKRTVRFSLDTMDRQGRLYSWGWKKIVLAENNVDPIGYAARRLAELTKPGSRWVVEFKSPQLEVKSC